MIYLILTPTHLIGLDDNYCQVSEHTAFIDSSGKCYEYNLDTREFRGPEAQTLYNFYFKFLELKGVTWEIDSYLNDPSWLKYCEDQKALAHEKDLLAQEEVKFVLRQKREGLQDAQYHLTTQRKIQ